MTRAHATLFTFVLTVVLTLAGGPARAAADPQVRPSAPAPAANGCVVCHGKENREFQASIHAKGGVTCTSCHGGSAESLDVAGAHGDRLQALRDPKSALESCGSCHSDVEKMRVFGLRTDQLSLYWTSQHGIAFRKNGGQDVATCISCHGSHGVLAAKNPLSPVSSHNQIETCGRCHADEKLMSRYGVKASVVAEYRGSVHGRALLEEGLPAAPTCADCHGSHGALPPRFADVQQVCGACHSTVQSFFARSPHAPAPGRQGSIQCTTCHSDHAVARPSAAMFLGDDPGHCAACHAGEQDPAAKVAQHIYDDVQKLHSTIEEAERAVLAAGGRGLFLGPERNYVNEARGLLVRSRAMTHTVSPAALDDILNRGHGMVGQTLESLDTKNRTFRDRRIFTGIFLALSVAFAVVLWMHGYVIRTWLQRAPGRRAGGR